MMLATSIVMAPGLAQAHILEAVDGNSLIRVDPHFPLPLSFCDVVSSFSNWAEVLVGCSKVPDTWYRNCLFMMQGIHT